MKVFEELGDVKPNLEIIATHVRHGQQRPNYILRDVEKFSTVLNKWEFEPKADPLSRCGYDYQVVATNGETTINLSICFACKTLVLNHQGKFSISPRQILKLFADDFNEVS